MNTSDQDRTVVLIALGGALLAAAIVVSRHETSPLRAADAQPTFGTRCPPDREPSHTGPRPPLEHGGVLDPIVDIVGHAE